MIWLKQEDKMLWFIGCLPVIWAGLLIGQSLGGGLADIMENLSVALVEPLHIRWTAYSLPAVVGLPVMLWFGFEYLQLGARQTP